MADRFTPPFTIRANESACWLEDAAGVCFAYTYFDREIVGTGVARPTRKAALRITRVFAQAPEWVKRPPQP